MAVGTTRGAHLGGAYVTVDAEVGGFGGRLIAKLRKELKAADAEARARGRELGKELADGILQGFTRRMPGLRREIEAMINSIKAKVHVEVDVDKLRDASLSVTVDLDEPSTKKTAERVKNTGRQIQRDVTDIAGGIAGRLASIAAGLSKHAESALKQIKTVSGTARGNAIVVAAALELIYMAVLSGVAAFNALGRELTNVLKLGLLLPGLITAIIAVAAPMALVFRGLSDDLAGVFDADPKKSQEALKKLSGSVREFAKELKAAKPWLDDLTKSLRETFFKNIVGIIPHFIKNFGDSIKRGFNEIADSVGRFFRTIFEALSTPETLQSLDFIFKTVSGIIDKLSGPAANFFVAMRNAAVASMPALDRFFGFIGTMFDEFSNWINEAVADGRFEQWLDDAMTTLNELYDLLKAVMESLGIMFDEGNQEGDSFLKTITDLVNEFNDFAESKDGELAIEGIAVAAEFATMNLKALLYVVWALVTALADLLGAVNRAIDAIKRLFHEAYGYNMGAVGSSAIKTAKNIATRRAVDASLGHFADGGIINEPTVATFAEDGPEAAIPLTKPGRALQLLRQSGLDKLALGHAEQSVQVSVFIGNEQLDSRVYQVVERATDASVTRARMSGLDGVTPQ